MNDHRQARTLKDQLESIIADMERRIADDPDRLYGGEWFQLTDEEEEVFSHRPRPLPRMVMTYNCYEVFKLLSDDPAYDSDLIQQARQLHPEWCGEGVSPDEFADFAETFASVTNREAHAIYAKQDFWSERAGVNIYRDGS